MPACHVLYCYPVGDIFSTVAMICMLFREEIDHELFVLGCRFQLHQLLCNCSALNKNVKCI